MKWDISSIDTWKAEDFPMAGVIPEAGNSQYYRTGGWCSNRPVRDKEICTDCLICWIVCPDSAIRVVDEKLADDAFALDHCKGCGVCANECPVGAITMVPECRELPEVE